MTIKRKPKIQRSAPEMCDAILRVRQASGLTQQAFAEKLGTAVMTLSKWENGKYQPRSREVFRRLRDAAVDAGLTAEQLLFEERVGPPPFPMGIEDHSIDQRILSAVGYSSALVVRLGSVSEWQEFHAYRIARSYLPEVGNAMHDAGAPARELVKEIVAEEAPDDGKLDIAFFNRLSIRMDILAAQKVFPHKFPTTTENNQ